jgi:hypothetical protein
MDPKRYNREIEVEIADIKKELESEKISAENSSNNGSSIEIVFRGSDSESRCIINSRIILYENMTGGKRYVRTASSTQNMYERVRTILQTLVHNLVFEPSSVKSAYVRNLLDHIGGKVNEILLGDFPRGRLDRLLCSSKVVMRSVKMPEDLDKALRIVAKRLGVSVSELIRLATVATVEALAEGDITIVVRGTRKTFVEVDVGQS